MSGGGIFRLLPAQVEYAMEAIGHAGTCLGILANDGIVLAAERRNTNKLLDEVNNSVNLLYIICLFKSVEGLNVWLDVFEQSIPEKPDVRTCSLKQTRPTCPSSQFLNGQMCPTASEFFRSLLRPSY